MLRKILSLIDEGGHSFDDIARILNISGEDLSSMLFMLNRMGYLDVSCPSDGRPPSCRKCSMAKTCGQGHPGRIRIYLITDKGKRALADR